MSSIDERVVNMKFNNSQFESGIRSTLASLAGLKKGLQLDGAKKGLADLDKAGKSFNLSGMSTAISSVNTKFLALATIGVTALSALTSKAIAAGGALAKSITIDPIRDGLREYETNLNSIQTILANTGLEGQKGLDKVNAALGELNTYSDQTIYNFSEMARNIGTFTAAGVDLDTSTNAIKGIANLAAVSGSNSQQASTAMYQLSQALAAGKVSLMDWNSVVNAGMGGEVFQEALKETARVHGVAVDDIIKEEGSFRDSLKQGWITSEILTETLSKFTGDLNAKQLKTMGYNDKQIEGILKMGKTATNAATKVKTMSQLIGTLQESAGSGWAKTWELIFGDFEEARTLFTSVSNVLGGMISASAESRNSMIKDWKDLGGRSVAIEAIKNAFEGLMSLLKPIGDAFRQVFPATTGKQLYDMTVAIRDFTENLKIGGKDAENLKRTFAGVFAIFSIGWQIIKGFGRVFGQVFGTLAEGTSGVLDFTGGIGDFLVSLDEAIKKGEGFNDFFDGLGRVLSVPVEMLKVVAQWIGQLFTGDVNSGPIEGAMERIGQRLEPLSGLIELASKAWDAFLGSMQGIWNFMLPFAEAVGSAFSELGTAISESIQTGDFSGILDAINTGLFGGLVLVLKKFLSNGINVDFGGGFFENISGIFEGLTDTLGAMQAQLKANTLIKIAGAVGILTASVVALSLIDSGKLTKALTAMTVMFTQLFASMAIFEKIAATSGFVKMPIIASSMILLSTAVVILTAAVKNLSGLDWQGLAKGLSGVAVLLGSLVGVSRLMGDAGKRLIPAGIGMIGLATAVLILSKAVGSFAGMSWESLGKGMAGVAASLILITGAMMLMPANMPLTAAGLVIVGGALLLIGQAVENMGSMSWEEIARGMVVLFGSLAILAAGLYAMTAALPGAAALIVASGALVILGQALTTMGGMSWGEVAVAMVALTGSLLILAAGLTAMIVALPGAAALVVAAAALMILAPALILLGSMSWGELGMALVTLASALTVLGVAGIALIPAIPGLIGLGAAVLLVGAGALAAGLGLLAFSAGLTALSVAGAAGAAALTAIAASIIGLIPMALKAVGEGLVLLAGVIAKSGPAMTNAMATLIMSMLNAINRVAPKIIDTIGNLAVRMVRALQKYVPQFVDAGMKLIIGILNGVSRNIDQLVTAGTNVVLNFMRGIQKNTNRVVDAGYKMIIDFINKLASTIRTNQAQVDAAMRNLADAAIDAFVSSVSNVGSIGADIVRGIAGGITGNLGTIASAARSAASSALATAKDVLGIRSPSREFAKLGRFVNLGFAKGLRGNSRESVKAAYSSMNDMLKDVIKTTSDRMDKYQDRLKELAKMEKELKKADDDTAKQRAANAKRQKDIDVAQRKATKALTKATKEHNAAVRARNYLLSMNTKGNRGLADEQKRLRSLAYEYERYTARLDKATQKLKDAKKTRDDYNRSIRDQYKGMADIGEETTLKSYLEETTQKIEDTNKFATLLQRLRSWGLNDKVYKDLLSKGTDALPFIESVIKGGRSGVKDINALSGDLNKASAKLGDKASKNLYQAGVNAAQGLVNGLVKKRKAIDREMERIANKMVQAIRRKLKIKSPSRVLMEVGKFTGEGLAKGLENTAKTVEKAGGNVADGAINSMKNTMSKISEAVNSDVDSNPTIRPVLDLTNIRNGASQMGSMLEGKQLSVGSSYSKAYSISEAARSARATQDELALAGIGSQFSYVQNNYSPKALSNAEIYRQTKNQISTVKGGLRK